MSARTLLSLLGAALLLLGGCDTVVKRRSAKEYYNEANEAYSNEDFTSAVDFYHDLLDQYPLNPYAEESQLKVAYSYYIEKKYAEAIASLNDFERAYPTSMHLPFVEYYRGMSYLEQMRSIDRDQAVTDKAHEHFRAVTDRFPDSAFASLAEKKVRVCREALASHELMVADFYDRYNNVAAAKSRLRTIIEDYPETAVTADALGRLRNLLDEEGKKELAELAEQARALRQPNTPAPEKTEGRTLGLRIPFISQEPSSPASEKTESEAAASSALPAPGVDPLLSLVTELKKQEDEIRKKVQEAIRAAAEKPKEKTEKSDKTEKPSETEKTEKTEKPGEAGTLATPSADQADKEE
jgi:outer membrane protein assembly factor BamD